jgi:hypothetical protein
MPANNFSKAVDYDRLLEPLALDSFSPQLHVVHSEMRARHEDEQYAQCNGDRQEHERHHRRSSHEPFSDEWLSDTRPVHPGVLTEAEVRHDDIEFVLV